MHYKIIAQVSFSGFGLKKIFFAAFNAVAGKSPLVKNLRKEIYQLNEALNVLLPQNDLSLEALAKPIKPLPLRKFLKELSVSIKYYYANYFQGKKALAHLNTLMALKEQLAPLQQIKLPSAKVIAFAAYKKPDEIKKALGERMLKEASVLSRIYTKLLDIHCAQRLFAKTDNLLKLLQKEPPSFKEIYNYLNKELPVISELNLELITLCPKPFALLLVRPKAPPAAFPPEIKKMFLNCFALLLQEYLAAPQEFFYQLEDNLFPLPLIDYEQEGTVNTAIENLNRFFKKQHFYYQGTLYKFTLGYGVAKFPPEEAIALTRKVLPKTFRKEEKIMAFSFKDFKAKNLVLKDQLTKTLGFIERFFPADENAAVLADFLISLLPRTLFEIALKDLKEPDVKALSRPSFNRRLN